MYDNLTDLSVWIFSSNKLDDGDKNNEWREKWKKGKKIVKEISANQDDIWTKQKKYVAN